jgi:hypothetical protein
VSSSTVCLCATPCGLNPCPQLQGREENWEFLLMRRDLTSRTYAMNSVAPPPPLHSPARQSRRREKLHKLGKDAMAGSGLWTDAREPFPKVRERARLCERDVPTCTCTAGALGDRSCRAENFGMQQSTVGSHLYTRDFAPFAEPIVETRAVRLLRRPCSIP